MSTTALPIEPQKIELLLSQLDSLPALAPVATRILSLTGDDHSNAKQLIEAVGSDPSLTARVLSVLGSAQYGVRTDSVNLDHAIKMLGFQTIRQLALAAKVMEVFGSTGKERVEDGLDRREFWKHCLGVACAARGIAAATKCGVAPEEAFVLGLLHDLGKVALDTVMPKSYARVVRQSRQAYGDIADIERAILGVDHTVVGHRLAERWNLPQSLVECIWLHHQAPESLPASVAKGRHVQVVQLADMLVRRQRIGFSGNYTESFVSESLAAELGLTPDAQRAIMECLADEIEARATWIGIDDITSQDVYLRALLQTTEELTVSNAALSDRNRRLQREAGYFSALGWMSATLSPKAAVRDVCGIAADAVRRALHVAGAAVFVVESDGRWVESGIAADGDMQGEIIDFTERPLSIDADVTMAMHMAAAGTWLSPPGRSFDVLVDRCRAKLGDANLWLLPIVCRQRWQGAAVFSASMEEVAQMRAESACLEVLSAAVGLAIAQSQAQASALCVSDELAEANRRQAALQAELVQMRSLETTVALAAGAAHELNNPLAVISGRAQMLSGRAPTEQMRTQLDQISTQAQLASDIVTELMDFAQPRPPAPKHVALPDALDALRTELASTGLLAFDELSVQVESDTPPIWFDAEYLSRLLREVLNNSIEATVAGQRRLTVKAVGDLTEETVVVQVVDNGRGMTPEILSRAKDPFFSWRPAGRGRGLGLARVARWLADGGGSISIQSRPGDGTTVELRFRTRAARS
ncbi:MAG: HDOD domain-containing protein [Planctomycetota bacterium]